MVGSSLRYDVASPCFPWSRDFGLRERLQRLIHWRGRLGVPDTSGYGWTLLCQQGQSAC
jgi:hypothetical protein